MARIAKATIDWTGFIGAPGYTNLYFGLDGAVDWTQEVVDDVQQLVDAFLTAVRPSIASTATTRLSPTLEEIDDTNGNLQAFWTMTPAAAAAGGAAGNYSAASGACIAWYTDGIVRSRRVRGRSFLVPLGQGAMAADGTLDNVDVTTILGAANTLITHTGSLAQLVIWSRPRPGLIPGTEDPGASFPVTSANINDKVAILRSRRD